MNIKTRGGDADLAVVAELADHGGLGDLRDVGVWEYDQRGMSAEFEAQALNLIGRPSDQFLADLGRPGEANLSHRVVFEECVGKGDRLRRNDVGDPRRQAGIDQTFEDPQ